MNGLRGFSLIEVLVVITIIGVVMAVSMPALSRAREQARVVSVNGELRQIALCLEMYMQDHAGRHPPARKDCSLGWDDYQLPPELVDDGYLPASTRTYTMSTGIEDRFDRDHTYSYQAVGPYYQNQVFMQTKYASLYIPPGFPDREADPNQDLRWDDPKTSPVTWVVYSHGPRFDAWTLLKQAHGPVPRRTWYDPGQRKGLVTRMRLNNGRQIGSFGG